MRNFLKGTLKLFLFIGLFCVILALVMNVLVFKQEDGTLPVSNYYDLPKDTVDVLILGTSHAGMNISTKTLFDEYGIAGYRFWGSVQPIWNTYYYLLEALKYQTPKVVLLDAHALTFAQEYGSYPVQVKNTIAFRPSREKIDNIRASVPEDARMFMFLGFPVYHNRYNELTEDDFDHMPWDINLGIQVLSSETSEAIYPFTILDKDATSGELELHEKEENYFRMLLQYCKDHDIALEVIASPYEISPAEQQKYRRIASVVEEYGYCFTNFCESYQEFGIDPQRDYLDPGHFNKTGVPKYARALAESILSKYDLPDRRNDPDHIWNQVKTQVQEPFFALTEQFIGDGLQNELDTGIRLFENPLDSWTLCTEFTIGNDQTGDAAVFSCFDNLNDEYGLRVMRNNSSSIEVFFGKTISTRLRQSEGTIRLGIIKMGKHFQIYENGELIEDRNLDNSELPKYDGPLVLGCELDNTGNGIHYSKTVISDLVIYDTALSSDELLAWRPSSLPVRERVAYFKEMTDDRILVSLENRFSGDGESYLDTGIRLYEDAKSSWTILSQIDPDVSVGDRVYYSCFSEEEGNYRGILVRKLDNNILNIVYGNGYGLNLDLPEAEISKLVIVKDRSAYTIYLNGEKVLDNSVVPCDDYDGPLMLGCERDGENRVFRISGTTVYNFDVYEGILSEDQLAQWQPEPLQEAVKDPGMDVTYSLSAPFVGDGKDAYLDTGIKLFDNAGKNWRLEVVLDQVVTRRGTVLSCFDENPKSYHGLIIRQLDDLTFVVITGTETTEVDISPSSTVTLAIEKEDSSYRIYVDGECIAVKESKCGDYLGNLYLCCERTQNGFPFRFSDISIRSLEISSSVS